MGVRAAQIVFRNSDFISEIATKLLHYTTWPSGLGGRKDPPPPSLSLAGCPSPPRHKASGTSPGREGVTFTTPGNQPQEGTICDSHVPFQVLHQKESQKAGGGGWESRQQRASTCSLPLLSHTLQHIGITCSGNWVSRRACAPESLDGALLMDEKQFVFEHILTWAKFLSTIEVSSRGRAECVPAKVNT